MKEETIADILREMREIVDHFERDDEYCIATDSVRVFADRIEAAAISEVRECGAMLAEMHTEIDRLRSALKYIAEATSDEAARKPWHSIAHLHEVAANALKEGALV